MYTLIDKNGKEYLSKTKGIYGGHKRSRCYGKMDCPSALRWISKGKYISGRVFFANEYDALMAGYHPCAVCMRDKFLEWKKSPINYLQKVILNIKESEKDM